MKYYIPTNMDLRKLTCLVTLIVLISGFTNSLSGQSTIVSVATGNWSDGATWAGGVVPGPADNAVISAGTIVSLLGGDVTVHSLTIDYEGILNSEDRVMTVNGVLTVNGIFTSNNVAAGDLQFNGDTIGGSGDIIINFPPRTVYINSNAVILSSSGLFIYGNVRLGSSVTVTNRGRVEIAGDLVGTDASSSIWTNSNDSYLAAGGSLLSTGTLNAAAPGNTVEYNMIGDQAIKSPSSSTYHNIIIRAAGNKNMVAGMVVNNSLRIDNSATLASNNFSIVVGGDWINYSNFSEGLGTVTFSGTAVQNIINPAEQVFYNLRVNKTAGEVLLSTNVIIRNILTMSAGIINSGSHMTVLGTGVVAGQQGSLSYTAGFIKGKFQRWINFSGTHHFPVGAVDAQRLAMTLVGLNASGTITAEFIPSDPGNNGLSLDDAGTTIYNTFVEGYWSVTSGNGFDLGFGNSYNLQLYGTGFTSFPIDGATRILTRVDAGSNWIAEGSHQDASGVTARRTLLTTVPAQFALGDDTDCTRPVTSVITGDDEVCTGESAVPYSVVGNPLNSYTWTITGGVQVSGGTTSSITVNWGATGTEDASVSVVESNACTEGARVTLPVTVHSVPPASITGSTSVAEYSTGVSYSVPGRPGYTYNWLVTGGNIVSGATTNTITVDWGAAGNGSVTVTARLAGCNPAPPVMIDVRLYDVIQSIASGSWDNPATWDCGCEPLPTQSVRISSGHTVTLHSSPNIEINNIVIDAGATLDYNGNPFTVHGDFFVNGTYAGDASAQLSLDGIEKVIDGTGTITGGLSIPSGSKTIASTASLNIASGDIAMGGSVYVTNYGTITLGGSIFGTDGATTWINDENSVLQINGELLTTGKLLAEATGNRVIYGGNAQGIKIPASSVYYNLEIAGTGPKSLLGPVQIEGDLELGGSGTFDVTAGNFPVILRGNWVNSGASFNPRGGTVTFDGMADQSVTGPVMFYNLAFTNNSGDLAINSSIVVRNNLAMEGRNIVTGSNILTIGVDAATAGSLTYSSGTIVGRIERWANTFGNILFPVGTATSHNPANIYINIMTSPGSVIAEFIASDPGNAGLPLLDGTTDVRYHFSDGYWNMTATNGFASGNYNIELVANNFTSDILNINTRILKRENGGDWLFDGTHSLANLPYVYRDFLTGGLSAASTQFGLAFACAPYTITGLVTATSCFGYSDGEIDITPSGGTAPYSFIWMPGGATTEDLSGLPAGSYSVTVTDDRGCVTPETFNVSQPGPLTIDEVVTDATCAGTNDGAIDISVEGGTIPYIYTWSTLDGSGLIPGNEDQVNLTPGTYSLLLADINGCSTTRDITVQVGDVTPPVMTSPGDITASCDISEQPAYLSYAEFVAAGGIAVDDCGINAASFTLVSETSDGLVCPETVTRIYSVEDNNGNLATCIQYVIVHDLTSPTASNPPQLVFECAADVPAPDIGVVTDAADNCTLSPVVAFFDEVSDGNSCPELITRRYSVTDDCGNSILVTQLISIEDITPPVISGCPANINVNTDAGLCGAIVSWIPPTVADNCGIATFTSTHNPGDLFPAGTTTVVYTATDNCGLVSTCSFDVTVTDNVPPVAVCQDIVISVDALCNATIVPSDIDGGSTDDCGIASLSVSRSVFTCADIGPNTVTLTVTDLYGNVSTCDAVVTVTDNTPPVALCRDITVYLDPSGSVTITAADVDDGSYDTGGLAGISIDISTFDCSNIGPNTVTLTATDTGGNSSTCTSTVTVVDNMPPVANEAPGSLDITLDCSDAAGLAAALASMPTFFDNCSLPGNITVIPTGDITTPDPSCGNGYTRTRSWEAVDEYANTSIPFVQVIVVQDNTLPVLNPPADILVECPADVPAAYGTLAEWITAGGTASDDCGLDAASFTLESEVSDGATCPEVITRTYSVADNCNNITYAVQTITVQDLILPVLVNCPADIIVPADAGLCSAVVSWTEPTATDNCNVASLVSTHSPGSVFAVGTTTVIYTATDDCGNTVNCTFDVTVTDTELPAIACLPDQARNNTPGSCDYTVNGGEFDPSISDNCSAATITNDINGLATLDGVVLPAGVTTVTWTATDASGNISTCQFDITITDNEPPTLVTKDAVVDIGPGNIVVIDSSFVWDNLASGDNCGIVTVTIDRDTFGCSDLGDNVVNVTATDAAGNSTVSTATVTVNDPSVIAADAGPDAAICITDAIHTISGSSVTNGNIMWGTTGDGTFNDPTLLTPTYTLGATDADSVKLYMDITATVGCKTASDTMKLMIFGIPSVDAGPDIEACTGDGDIAITGATYSNGVITWSTSGDGSFDDAGIINPVYTFGPSDTGPVTLTVTVTSPGSCGTAIDDLVVTFVPGPVADAGADDAICASAASYPVTDGLSSGGAALWTTAGDGTFDDATSDNPLYTFGPGDYSAGMVTLTMTVTGTGSCGADIDDKIITINPVPVIVVDEHSDITCNGLTDGIIRISGSGATAPYLFSFEGGPYQLSGEYTGLSAGSYDLTIMDANGCTRDTSITIIEPAVFDYTLDAVSNNSCFGANDGSISITINGGTTPYVIIWTGPNGFSSTDEDISGLEPGTYNLNLTDANNCASFNLSQDITAPAEIVITPGPVSDYNGFGVSCNGANDGSIETIVSGGTGTLVIAWTGPNGFTSASEGITGLEAGTYILTVTDDTGCSVNYSVELAEPDPITITYDVTPASCPGDANGQIDITVTGGALPYSFLWGDGDTGEDRVNVIAGDYTLIVTDINGCSEQEYITVGIIGLNCVVVPTVITPGVVDGKNDVLIIKNIDLFPEAEIKIFTRWGKLIYNAKNLSQNRWDGTYQGKLMPVDSYHYILDLKDGTTPMNGTITIIR